MNTRPAAKPHLLRLRLLARGGASTTPGAPASSAGEVYHPDDHQVHNLIQASGTRVAWAPEFLEFPSWAAGTDLMFAEAAGWARPIRFAKDTGGHAPALEVAEQAVRHGVRRLVFAHIGRPTIKALDAGHVPPFGEIGTEGATYTVARS